MNKSPSNKNSHSSNYKSRYNSNLPRKDKQIRAKEVRVIDKDGNCLGVMQTYDALKLAVEAGLSLVEVSPNAQPPVCKILDFGKYMYEEGKKTKTSKNSTTKLKEIKLSPSIEKNDYLTKLRHAEEFLYKGNKVKLYIMLKGRQMGSPVIAMDVVKKMTADLTHIGLQDAPPAQSGRNISVLISPVAAAKRTLVHAKKELGEPEE